MILLQVHKIEQVMKQQMNDRMEGHTHFKPNSLSDHYSYMFQLLCRFKSKIRKIINGEKKFSLRKFVVHYPQIVEQMNQSGTFDPNL